MLATAGLTYLIRSLPMLLFRGKIKSVFFRSFLYYVPYVVLSTLAFPAILFCTDSVLAGLLAAVVCAILAYRGKSLLICMLCSVATVLAVEGILMLI